MLQSYNMLFEFMEVLGKKWIVPLLLFLLLYENTTFSKIKKHLRVTSRALSKKLKLLEALGLVEKIVIDSPRKAGYTLSEKGKEVSQMLLGFATNISK
ncbi:winged helix-turn-helix transcriptional regulator [Candidatus Woesearchaeota archaeon]|nr:winged helix-turn-helix transcriptional regulator [Candidatus Woesearchaeota archaeon]